MFVLNLVFFALLATSKAQQGKKKTNINLIFAEGLVTLYLWTMQLKMLNLIIFHPLYHTADIMNLHRHSPIHSGPMGDR